MSAFFPPFNLFADIESVADGTGLSIDRTGSNSALSVSSGSASGMF